jgi:hypothetical protein
MLANIVGHIVNFVAGIPHLLILLFHNFINLAFVVGIFYGLFRLGQKGWRKLRGDVVRQDHPEDAPKADLKNGASDT